MDGGRLEFNAKRQDPAEEGCRGQNPCPPRRVHAFFLPRSVLVPHHLSEDGLGRPQTWVKPRESPTQAPRRGLQHCAPRVFFKAPLSVLCLQPGAQSLTSDL